MISHYFLINQTVMPFSLWSCAISALSKMKYYDNNLSGKDEKFVYLILRLSKSVEQLDALKL